LSDNCDALKNDWDTSQNDWDEPKYDWDALKDERDLLKNEWDVLPGGSEAFKTQCDVENKPFDPSKYDFGMMDPPKNTP